MPKYYLSVGAIFKNESHGLEEWLKHYLHHGADHFYLINDKSTDNSVAILQPYIDKGQITLFEVDEPYYMGRQRNLYNQHILPRLKETQWLLMVDLDEYVWSPKAVHLSHILRYSNPLGQIQIDETVFGSNGHVEQPVSLVAGFTKREPLNRERDKKLKYFVNSDYEFSALNIHHADFSNGEYMGDISRFLIAGKDTFRMNHYNCQSLDFWRRVKMTRGDADNYMVRTEKDFYYYDHNEEEDLELCEQNKTIV